MSLRACRLRWPHYSLGSVLNHVLLHQTVIGLEAREQLALAAERLPDVVIAPCGGGSNLGGIAFPFVPETGVRLLAVEPLSCPTLTQGRIRCGGLPAGQSLRGRRAVRPG
jgi:tryptophan synthase beta chain